MSNQSSSVSARHLKDRAEKKPKQGAIRIVTHGITDVKNSSCVWLWTAFDGYSIVANQSGVRGYGYGVTPNSAQFHAVIEALGWLAVNMPDEPIRVLCDAELIVKLVNGQNKTRKPHLNLLCQTAKQFLSRTKATLEWKPSARGKRVTVSSSKDFSKVERGRHASI
jgi:ribonuclease HI